MNEAEARCDKQVVELVTIARVKGALTGSEEDESPEANRFVTGVDRLRERMQRTKISTLVSTWILLSQGLDLDMSVHS